MSKAFNLRKWLNPRGSHSSGSVFAFHGNPPWSNCKKTSVLEIADCHCKVRLHQAETDTKKDFAKKLKRLRSVIDAFIKHLES